MFRATSVLAVITLAALLEACPGRLMNPERFRDSSTADSPVVDTSPVRCTLSMNVEADLFAMRCGAAHSQGSDASSPGGFGH